MDLAELSRVVDDIARQYTLGVAPGYFDCLEALDMLEFHILDRLEGHAVNGALAAIQAQAMRLHAQLTAVAQAAIDHLVQDIRSGQLAGPALKARFAHDAAVGANNLAVDAAGYDRFDEFLSQLLQVDYTPSETLPRSAEMVYLQPTPGRVIMQMIAALPFSAADRFYDLGSGLGQVPILVALLTGTPAVGVEYEPTYSHYARQAAQKLRVAGVTFRTEDAQQADFRDGTIFFMYTPFGGAMLRRVLDRLRDHASERQITLCGYGPCTAVVTQEPWLRAMREDQGEPYRLAIFHSRA